MARRLSAEWQAEWCERLARFRDWTGTSADFCRHEGISRSSLYLWSRRLHVPVMSRSRPGTGLAVSAIQRHMPLDGAYEQKETALRVQKCFSMKPRKVAP